MADTNLLFSSPLSEFTFFLVLVALHFVVTVHGSVVQERDSSVSQSLPLQDLLLLSVPPPPQLPSHRPQELQEPHPQQLFRLHLLLSLARPEHVPPEQLLDRVFFPVPQVTEQLLQDPQEFQLPTGEEVGVPPGLELSFPPTPEQPLSGQ